MTWPFVQIGRNKLKEEDIAQVGLNTRAAVQLGRIKLKRADIAQFAPTTLAAVHSSETG